MNDSLTTSYLILYSSTMRIMYKIQIFAFLKYAEVQCDNGLITT